MAVANPPVVLKNLKTKAKVAVSDQVVDVVEERGLEGAPTLTVDVTDPDWLLVNAPILDLDVDGRLDHVEIEHNAETFRLVSVSPVEGMLTLTFEDSAVSILRKYKKPRRHKAVPGYTRAMFIEGLVNEARKDGNEIFFASPDLRTKDRIRKRQTKDSPPDKGGTGKLGFSKGAHLTVKGVKADKSQRHLATIALTAAHDLDAPKRAQWALMEACIQESSIRNLPGGDGTSVGILQLTAGKKDRRNVESVVKRFLSEGFTGRGGAIELANTTNLPPHLIAQAVQGSAYADGAPYQQWEAEAKEWVRRFHGVPDGSDGPPDRTVTVDAARWFQRGQNGQTESSWACMVRLASEVNARIWVSDNVVRYAFDETLFKQAPRNVLNRLKPSVYSTSFQWDQGQPVKVMNVAVEGYDLWPGQTLDYVDAGPASGRWLIWSVRRTRSTGQTEVELHQPQPATILDRDTVDLTVPGYHKGKGKGGTDGSGRGLPDLPGATTDVLGQHGRRLIGTPGVGTHSWTDSPTNWESDNAVDLGTQYGTNVYAAFDGRIGSQIGELPGGGGGGRFAGKRLHLIGKHNELYYAHLSIILVHAGQRVKKGQRIGLTGEANGVEHLHLGEKAGYTGGPGSAHPYLSKWYLRDHERPH